jgi:hypothetical protein
VAGRYVEKAKLICASCIIGRGGLDGVAGINEIDEIYALDDAAVLDVKAGDDANFQHTISIILLSDGQQAGYHVSPSDVEHISQQKPELLRASCV